MTTGIELPGALNLILFCLLFTLITKNMVVNEKSRYFFSLEEIKMQRRAFTILYMDF